MPGIISLVDIRCLCTTLFPDLNLAGGRNSGTGSKPKAGTSSPDKLMVIPNKESIKCLNSKRAGETPRTPVLKTINLLFFTIQGGQAFRLLDPAGSSAEVS